MKIGFTIGKFAPLHKGHESLIEKGLRENDEFYILINETNLSSIPLKTRAGWIQKMYPKAHIILGENPPQKYGMDEQSVKIQTDYLKEMFKDIPVTTFYCSEDYGKFVARDLNVEMVKVDKIVPISATKIRDNPKKNKKYMEEMVYKHFIN